MKTIGRTNNRGVIVEMSEEEHRSFYRLQSTLNGKGREISPYDSELDGTDLSTTFVALEHMYAARESLNWVVDAVQKIDIILGKIKSEK